MRSARMGIPYHLLHDTATIQTPTQSTDSAGSPTTTYSGTATVACRVDADSSQDAARYMRETGLRRSTGYFPPTHTDGTALTLNKTTRVVVGSVTYRVVGPATNAADVEVLQVVTLEEDT